MGILTRQQKGSALTINEMDNNFMSSWEIITGGFFNQNVTNTSTIDLRTNYYYASRFNCLAFEISGRGTNSALWYPNWISHSAGDVALGNPVRNSHGNTRLFSQSYSFFGSWNSATGWPIMSNSNSFTPFASHQTYLRGMSYFQLNAPTSFELTGRLGNGGYQRVTGAFQYSTNYNSQRKIGIQFRTLNNSNSYNFAGTIYLLGLRAAGNSNHQQ